MRTIRGSGSKVPAGAATALQSPVRTLYTRFTAVPKARVDDGVLRESLATTRVGCLSGCHQQGGRRLQQRNGSVVAARPSRCQRLGQGLSSLIRLIAQV